MAALLARLAVRGFGSQSANTLRQARELLETFRFDVALAAESVSDGRGYDLAESVARHFGTLLVAVPLSETCLWLPVIERGANVLGARALNARVLELELEMLLGDRVLTDRRRALQPARLANGRPDSDRTVAPRRRNGGLAA
jgi:hypothetical protein